MLFLYCIGGGLGWVNGVLWVYVGEWYCCFNEYFCYVIIIMWIEIMMVDIREIRCCFDIFKFVFLYFVSVDVFELIVGSCYFFVDLVVVRKVVVGLFLFV